MKCPECQTEIPENSKFCLECGTKIDLTCPGCGKTIPPGSKYCLECGYFLTQPSQAISKELSFDEKIAKIQKYLPSGITEKILSQRDRIEGENRQVTVMFCDMKGFTPLSEKLGPETTYAMMDEVYEILIHKVHDYEGTVNEMTGDGIMALFGAPIALEDAPQRAISSAMAIHREMTRFNERMRQEKGEFPPVKMRIGIHTGPVVVGTLGNDLRVEFKAVGDTVNLASRMESLAEPGTTYISEETFRITEGLFRVEALGEKNIKGKEKPHKVYQVIAPSSRRTRFDVSAERGLTPFVGRQRELELLLDGFERSREGRGQAISIISEAGIGKSRLLYEFRKAVTNEDVTFLEGRCLSYSKNAAYHPIVDILKANFEIQESDTDQQICEKVADFLKIVQVDELSTLPYLLELLSVKDSGIDKIQMSPEARKYRTFEAIKRISLKGSELRPLIMAVEDLHWTDRSSEDAFKELLESISGSRIFLIFTYRPDFIHTWGSRSYHSQITLNKLSNRESLAMVSHLLNTVSVDKEIEDLTLSKAEGIPFFIEEFIKSLRDMKIIEKSNDTYKMTGDLKAIAIPSTIHDVIMARVDHLPEGAREVLRTGSVIEREFSHEMIRKMTGLPEQELLSQLSILKDSELLYERGIYPNSAYIFKHALTREVIYDSILTKKKKQLHEKIARAIEEINAGNISDCYGVLTSHCMACEDYEKGAEYSILEAERLYKDRSLRDAIDYAKKAVVCSEKLPRTEANKKNLIDARTALSFYYLNLNMFYHARDAVEPILDLAVALNYQKRLPVIYMAIGSYYLWVEEDSRQGLMFTDKAMKIAEEIADYFSFGVAIYLSGGFMPVISEFKEAHKRLKQVLDFGLLANDTLVIAHSKGSISFCYAFEGKINPAHEFAQEILNLAKETGDALIKGMAYSIYGGSCYLRGLINEAKAYLLEWAALYEKTASISFIGYAYIILGYIYIDLGEYDDAVHCYKKLISDLEKASFMPSMISYLKSCLMKVKVLRHDSDIELSELFAGYQNYKITWCKGGMARNLGDILLHIDDAHFSDAQVWFLKAIEEDKKNGFRWNLAMDHAFYAEWFKKNEDVQGAREQLIKAIDIFRECAADGWVQKYEKELSDLQ